MIIPSRSPVKLEKVSCDIPLKVVARCKALLWAGCSVRAVSSITGISIYTLEDYQKNRRKADVAPDMEFLQTIKALTLNETSTTDRE